MLTRQQELFVRYLAEGDSQRIAYKKAYPKSRAKDSTIDDMASKLFKKQEVKHRFHELQSEISEQTKKASIADATELLESLTSYIRADIHDMYEYVTDDKGVQHRVTNGNGGRIINDIATDSNGNARVRLPDRIQAIKLMADILNLKEKEAQKSNIKQDVVVRFEGGGDYFD